MKKVFLFSLVFIISLATLSLSACGFLQKEITKKTISFYVGDELYDAVRTAGNEKITMPYSPDGLGEFMGWYFDKGTYQNKLQSDTYLNTSLKKDVSVYAYFKVVDIESVSLDVQNLALNVGLSYTFTLNIAPKNGSYLDIVWSSSREEVASVLNGVANALSVGETVISATVDERYTAQCVVNVVDEDIEVELNVDGTPVDVLSTNYDKNFKVYPTVKDKYFPTEDIENGKYFDGWYTDEDFSTKFDESMKFTSDSSLYGRWLDFDAHSAFSLKYSTGKYVLTDCKVISPAIIVPSYYGGNKIYSIAKGAFHYTGYLNIHIPDSVEYIEEGAIVSSTVESLTLPFVGAYKEVGRDATHYPLGYIFGINNAGTSFGKILQYTYVNDVSSKKSVYYTVPKSLRSVTVTGGAIDYGAFQNISSLTNIVLPSELTEIGAYAFEGCAFSTVSLPSALSVIGEYAFSDCAALKEISLPDGLNAVNACAFFRCVSLEKIVFPSSVENIAGGVLSGSTALKSVTLPQRKNMILSANTFKDCIALEEVEIPDSYWLNGSVFASCTGLKTVIINDGVYLSNNKSNVFDGCVNAEFFLKSDSSVSAYNEKTWNKVGGSISGAVYVYSENEPQTDGNYWRYVDGAVTKWVK